MDNSGHIKNIFLLIGLGILFFVAGNGILPITNPDEAFYSLSAKEMIGQHSWLVPYIFGHPQFEKPIFLFWLLRLSFALFGVGPFAARLVPASFAILGCLGVYAFCWTVYKNKAKAFFCSVILMSAALYVGLARFLLTDMVLSVFILLALASFYWGYVRPAAKGKGLVLFFVFCALGVLTKGALGIVLPLAVVLFFLLARGELGFLFCRAALGGAALFLMIALPWYIFMIRQFGHSFIHEFIYNDHIRRIIQAEHTSNDRWYFYPLTMLVGMLPWSVPLLFALVWTGKQARSREADPVHAFLLSWVTVILAILLIAHSKLASYIFPVFPALAVMTGSYLTDLIDKKKEKLLFLLIILSLLFLAVLSLGMLALASGILPISFKYYEYLPDHRAILELLTLAAVVIGGALFFLLRKKHKYSVYCLALQLPLLISFVFLSRDKFVDYVSSQHVSAYLSQKATISNRILCSGMFARGLHYFTGKDVAVIGGGFFSPHPIPMLETEEAVQAFLYAQKITYAVVRKSQFKELEKLPQKAFAVTTLLHTGDAYVLKIRAL